jgi:uncharacterized protein YbaP (TraB family)
MKNLISGILIFLLAATAARSQEKRDEFDYLLWRISGKGLVRPSYVYGTMHLTDRRLFFFSDSLYKALEQSEGFATELDVNSLMPHIVSEMLSDDGEDEKVVSLVRAEWLQPHKKKLEKATRKKLEQITVGDLKRIKNKSSARIMKDGDMNTIMDMYLYDIARRQGKWVGGIEDIEDQLAKNPDREEETMALVYGATTDQSGTKKAVEWMINTYVRQDLSTIDLTNDIWRGSDRDILIRRNVKMARRMDSIMQIRTCLFAVGAAHIPGDSGVVTLLRKRGFTVEPVYSTKTIDPAQYRYAAKDISWVPVEIPQQWYSVDMPGKSEKVDMDDNIFLSSEFYLDLTRLNAYFTFSVGLPADNKKSADSMYRGLAKNLTKRGSILSEKSIVVNGLSGKEFLLKSEDADTRMQAFVADRALIVNLVSSQKPDSLQGSDAKKFFESFRVLKAAPVRPEGWKRYAFEKHAFSIEFPGEYAANPKNLSDDSTWRTRSYSASGSGGRISCWMLVMETGKGFFSDGDSTYFEEVKKNAVDNLGAKIISTSITEVEGFPAMEFLLEMDAQDQAVEISGRVVNRGNRRYYFYAVYAKDDSAGKQAPIFLNSFRLEPVPGQHWRTEQAPFGDIAVWSPSVLSVQQSNDDLSDGYTMYDSLAPASIHIEKRSISKYYWWKNDTALFASQAALYVREGDSLLSLTMNPGDTLNYADVVIRLKHNHNVRRLRLIQYGDTLYSVFTFLPPGVLANENYSRLFSDIKFLRPGSAKGHLVNKTAFILDQLHHADSADFAAARDALGDAPFTATDLPQLQQALLFTYRDFDINQFCTHDHLIAAVLDHDDGSTVKFINDHYHKLPDSARVLRYSLLSILTRLKTKESFALAKKLLTEGELPSEGSPNILRYGLNDSLELTATLFPEILERSADTAFIRVIPSFARLMLDSNLVDVKVFEPYKKNFYAFAERQYKAIGSDSTEYDSDVIHNIALLSHFNEPASWTLLQQFLKVRNLDIKHHAAITLIADNQPVDAAQLNKLAASDYSRLSLFEGLQKIGKEKLFPVKYLSQQHIARSEIFAQASDDGEPSSVIYLGERTATFAKEQAKFYLYKVTYEDGEQSLSYLGVAGPYPLKTGKLITSSKIGGLYTTEEFDAKKVNAQFKAYLAEWEEYLGK